MKDLTTPSKSDNPNLLTPVVNFKLAKFTKVTLIKLLGIEI